MQYSKSLQDIRKANLSSMQAGKVVSPCDDWMGVLRVHDECEARVAMLDSGHGHWLCQALGSRAAAKSAIADDARHVEPRAVSAAVLGWIGTGSQV